MICEITATRERQIQAAPQNENTSASVECELEEETAGDLDVDALFCEEPSYSTVSKL